MNKIKLYPNCIPVKGIDRSLICDIQRTNNIFVPNILLDIINEYDNCCLDFIYSQFKKEEEHFITEYIKYLNQQELILFTDIPEHFKKLSLNYITYSEITNAIVDIDAKNIKKINYKDIFYQLDELRCESLQIRFFEEVDIDLIENILQYTQWGKSRSIELILKYNDTLSIQLLKELHRENHRLINIVVHSSLYEKVEFINEEKTIPLIFILEKLNLHSCGKISLINFVINYKTFTESIHYNTCLNCKISIDAEGNIKNCPSMNCSFGNVKDTTLEEAINKPNFKDLWSIKKDEIDVCKDCEFRYMCTDCRCFIKDPNNIYSQPAKCSYNPYIALWKGQDGWISVEQWRAENPNWEQSAVRLIPGTDYYKND